MPLIQLNDIFVAFGETPVLDGVTLALQPGRRVGLIGANGTGKTTLLRIMAGAMAPDGGRVERAKALRIGFMEQEPDLCPDHNVHQAALSAFAELLQTEERMRALEHQIASADEGRRHDLLVKLGKLQEEFERSGGYERERLAETALMGLGFGRDVFSKPVAILSGGERSRVALARLLLREPDLLLLDEPTNHLDLAGIEWLEEFLAKKFKGTIVLVSHDRTFLDRTATSIWELDRAHVAAYPGNYTGYAQIREDRRLAQRREYEKQQEFVRKEEDFIRRYHAGQRGKEARGRQKRLDRIERVDAPTHDKRISLRFEAARESGEVCLRVEDLAKGFDDRTLFRDLSIEVYRGDRVGIIGPNGSGKTTLLRILLGQEAADAGVFDPGHHLRFGYLEQQAAGFSTERSVLDEVWERKRTLNEVDVRSILGRFLFSTDEAVAKRMCDLSGGERTRVALACLMIEQPNVLVLDEPTNHLDIASREALEAALKDYEGTIVAVSHDRYFLNRIVGKLIALDGAGGARVVHGNYQFYEGRRGKQNPQPVAPEPPEPPSPAVTKPKPRLSKNRLARLEGEIAHLEAEKERLEAELAAPDLYADPQKAQNVPARYEQVCAELDDRYHLWIDQ